MEEIRTNKFFVDVACDVGINASIIYFDICYWCAKNQENGDGFYMYSTMDDFSRRMPYLTVNQVRTALKKLRNGGYIQAKTMTVNHYTTSIDKDLCDRILGLNPEGGKFPNHFGIKPNDLKEEERKKEKNQKKIKKEEEKENGRKNDGGGGECAQARTHTHEGDKENLILHVRTDSIKRMGAMKSLGIRDEQKFYNLADAVMCEWEVTDDQDWSWRHLLNHMRIKLEKEDETKRKGRACDGDGKSRDERLAEYEAYLRTDTGSE